MFLEEGCTFDGLYLPSSIRSVSEWVDSVLQTVEVVDARSCIELYVTNCSNFFRDGSRSQMFGSFSVHLSQEQRRFLERNFCVLCKEVLSP